jgi:hypothetical protein
VVQALAEAKKAFSLLENAFCGIFARLLAQPARPKPKPNRLPVYKEFGIYRAKF